MKIKVLKLMLPFLLITLAGAAYFSEKTDRDAILIRLLMEGINQIHYQPLELDNNFAEKVFDVYMKQLDPRKRFFLQSDIDQLMKNKLYVDEEISQADFEFFEKTTKILLERQEEAECLYKEILADPFDFSKDESAKMNFEKRGYAQSEEEWRERWRTSLKYQTLTRLVDMIEEQEKMEEEGNETKDGEKKEIKTFEQMEKEARERVGKSYANMFSTIGKLDREDHVDTYLNSISHAFDPHTGYFPPADKENFDIAISGRLEGIGARLMDRDGFITVTEIVPGSASWRQGELKEEDVILKVAQGEQTPIDVVDMKLDDAVKLIRGPKDSEVRLTVKKPDNTTKVIPIIRDVVEIEESYAKSAVLEKEGEEGKLGYIRLPKFYAPFNKKEEGRSCATDVKKEIDNLSKEGVDGLIIDLRNNGGGSLSEVVDMAGLFIKEGPIVQVKGKRSRPDVLWDRDPSVTYDGPLVILVNGFSASASEILAAAIQDYKRGIIIGSGEATFGKGTVQRFIDLDRAINDYNELKPLGSVKLTIQKFYRINGGTNQLKGVIPDIALPDIFRYIETGEKQQDYAMEWDEINPLTYKICDDCLVDRKAIVEQSQGRVANSEIFSLVEANAKRMKKQREKVDYTLCIDSFRAELKQLEEENKKYDAVEEAIEDLKVSLTKEANEVLQKENVKEDKESSDKFLEGLAKDAYIYEAMAVLKDIKASKN